MITPMAGLTSFRASKETFGRSYQYRDSISLIGLFHSTATHGSIMIDGNKRP